MWAVCCTLPPAWGYQGPRSHLGEQLRGDRMMAPELQTELQPWAAHRQKEGPGATKQRSLKKPGSARPHEAAAREGLGPSAYPMLCPLCTCCCLLPTAPTLLPLQTGRLPAPRSASDRELIWFFSFTTTIGVACKALRTAVLSSTQPTPRTVRL